MDAPRHHPDRMIGGSTSAVGERPELGEGVIGERFRLEPEVLERTVDHVLAQRRVDLEPVNGAEGARDEAGDELDLLSRHPRARP